MMFIEVTPELEQAVIIMALFKLQQEIEAEARERLNLKYLLRLCSMHSDLLERLLEVHRYLANPVLA